MFEYDENEKRYGAMHHPFTSPREDDLDKLETDPSAVKALAYDLVLNGAEIGGGSIRIHRQDIQKRIFTALGLTPEKARERFGFFLDALESGTPPHGGIALGMTASSRSWRVSRTSARSLRFPRPPAPSI